MKNTCLGLLILLGTALGVEISGNGLVEKSNGNYYKFGDTNTRT